LIGLAFLAFFAVETPILVASWESRAKTSRQTGAKYCGAAAYRGALMCYPSGRGREFGGAAETDSYGAVSQHSGYRSVVIVNPA
jgi:hypothetical protein